MDREGHEVQPQTSIRRSRTITAAIWAFLLASTFTMPPSAPALAAALDPDSCAKLKTEQEAMEKAGLKDTVAKGPAWAKANAPPEKMSEIRRWIEVDEQLLFRCPGRHLVNLPLEPDPPPPPAPEEKKRDGEKADVPVAAPRPAPPEKKAAVPEKKQPEKKPQPQRKAPVQNEKTKTEGGKDPETKPAPKVKATAKQKPKDDAFKPPPSDGENPFSLN